MYKLPRTKINLLRAIAVAIAIFAIVVSVCTVFNVVYIRTYVNGKSMQPTLNTSFDITDKRDVVYINRFAKVSIDDIVVLDLRNHPNFSGYTVKRLIATEGDIVNIVYNSQSQEYDLLVNDAVFYSKPNLGGGYNTYNSFLQYIENHEQDASRIYKENDIAQGVIVKKGEIFVLGDNWEVSKDSSLVGPLKKNTIVGRVDIVVKPHQNEFVQILKRIF